MIDTDTDTDTSIYNSLPFYNFAMSHVYSPQSKHDPALLYLIGYSRSSPPSQTHRLVPAAPSTCTAHRISPVLSPPLRPLYVFLPDTLTPKPNRASRHHQRQKCKRHTEEGRRKQKRTLVTSSPLTPGMSRSPMASSARTTS